MVEESKICTKCGVEFPATTEFFHVVKHGKFGLNSRCKGCITKYSKENSKIAVERMTKWKNDNPDKLKEHTTLYYERHKEDCNKRSREYYKDNSTKINEWIKQWKIGNKDRVCWYSHKRRVLLLGLEYHHTLEDETSLWVEQCGFCYYCGIDLTTLVEKHLEHKIPLVRGGDDTKDNLCWSCPRCNYEKHRKTEKEYTESRRK